MKKMTFAMTLMALNSIHVSAETKTPCVAITALNSAFIEAALNSSDLQPQDQNMVSVALDRNGIRATVTFFYASGRKLQFDAEQQCSDGTVVAKLKAPNFVCKKYVDCMPSDGLGENDHDRYCSKEYFDWAEKNCGGKPSIVY